MVNGVHRTCRDGSSFMLHQPCQRCKYTILVDIEKRASHLCRITYERSGESAREWRIALYKSDQQHPVSEFRSCAKVEMAVLGPRPNEPYCCYERKANTEPCTRTGHSLSLIRQPTSEDMKLYIIINNFQRLFCLNFAGCSVW